MSPKVHIVPELFAIMAVDPGTTTGVVAGLFHPAADIQTCIANSEWESWEVEGTPAEQGWQIMDEFKDLQAEWNLAGVALPDIHLVSESFALRLKKAHGAGSDQHMLDPVRVIESMETLALRRSEQGYRQWVRIEYQLPSEAKGYVTNERMKRWGAWVVGSEHKRDAVRHLLKKISDII